jgi:hypothetical protein
MLSSALLLVYCIMSLNDDLLGFKCYDIDGARKGATKLPTQLSLFPLKKN